MKPKKDARFIDGILLLDKPLGLSSNTALQIVKRLFKARKAGHTGSLDPLASGMLPICLGECTKYSQYLLEADKSYFVKAKLGIRTTTSDAEGEIVSDKPVPTLTHKKVDQLFDTFRGSYDQVPSMYSALKYQGQPLYKLARQGVVVERKSRAITIYQLDVTNIDLDTNIITFIVKCSKGTYVRTLVDDFGELLGCGAHVSELRRLDVSAFREEEMVTLDALEALAEADDLAAMDQLLLPTDITVKHLPKIELSGDMAHYLCLGQPVFVPQLTITGTVRLYSKAGDFLGVGEILDDGRVAPKRLIQQQLTAVS